MKLSDPPLWRVAGPVAATMALLLSGCAGQGGAIDTGPQRPAPSASAADLQDPDTQLRLAQRIEAQGQIGPALDIYQSVLTRDPRNQTALDSATRLLMRTGYPEAADDYLALLQQLRPGDPTLALRRARALNRMQQPARAMEQLDLSARQGGSGAVIEPERGLALDLLGRQPEAQKSYAAALHASPFDLVTQRRLALSLAMSQDYGAALALLQGQVNDPAGAQDVRRSLALVYALSGQTDEALQIAATATSDGSVSGPPDPAVLTALRPFYQRLPALTPAQKARAVYFSQLPAEESPAASVADVTEPAEIRATELPPAAPPAAAASLPAPAASAIVPGSTIWLQLASLPSEARIAAAWADIRNQNVASIADRPAAIERVDVAGGVRYRLLVGGFADRGGAEQVAAQLKAQGQDSLLRIGPVGLQPLTP